MNLFFIVGVVVGLISAACVYGLFLIFKTRNSLPPVEGKTIVTRKNGKRYYRELPKKKPQEASTNQPVEV